MWLAYLLLTLSASHTRANLIGTVVTSWHWQSSVAVADHLYITGGEQYTGSNSFTQSGNTYVIDLTRPWTNQSLDSTSSSAPPSGMQLSRQPLVYYDQIHDTINRYGGWKYNITEGDSSSPLWSLDAKSANSIWTQGSNISPNGKDQTGPFAAATAFSNSTFFSVGGNVGQDPPDYNMTVLSGLVIQDLSSGTWRNISQITQGSPEYLTQARAAYVPNFGTEGTLIVVGGESPSTPASMYAAGMSMVDMSTITLFDVASEEWYKQKTTGDIPPPRSEFCAVGTPSEDGASYELFVYGGMVNETEDRANPDDSGYLNVYLLSLPAFRWFASNSSTPIRRAAHTCSIIGKRQMISVGGWFPSIADTLGAKSDPWTSGIGVFDMSEFAWKPQYDASAEPYEPPDVVQRYYTSSYQEPVWANSTLASTFKYTAKTPTGSTPTAPSSPASTSSTPIGAIVGGTVGGIAVLLAVLLYFGYLWRRRKRLDSESTHELAAQTSNQSSSDVKRSTPEWMAGNEDSHFHEVSGADRPAQELPSTPTAMTELPGHDSGTQNWLADGKSKR